MSFDKSLSPKSSIDKKDVATYCKEVKLYTQFVQKLYNTRRVALMF